MTQEYEKDIKKVNWLDNIDKFEEISVWKMWWVLLHTLRKILIILEANNCGIFKKERKS